MSATFRFAACGLAIAVVLAAGCTQKMARQPAYRPLQPSAFFPDDRSARPLVPGTIARGHLHADTQFWTGRRAGADPADAAAAVAAGLGDPFTPLALATAGPRYADTFPFPVTEEVLHRGRKRYNIFCAVCHDRVGTGNGMIVQRGFTRPPALVSQWGPQGPAALIVQGLGAQGVAPAGAPLGPTAQFLVAWTVWREGVYAPHLPPDDSRGLAYRGVKVRLDQVPPGYVFEVITNGYGAMPDYASQVPPRDRWAIAAYVRALQFSQDADAAKLSDEDRRELQRGGPP